ncbi:MAG: 3-hydroxyacyl-[acyl-carrier-protein] dehydratase FabZ [Pseudomonadota bacterium]|jgi:3-hydroxyacyl-[acyl-carrier-protein] dehydratase
METVEAIEAAPVTMDILEIQRWIPHRYPFLLIDRVVDLVPNAHITTIKNVTANEEFFQGHFPGHPVMPGVLIMESMAQTAAVFARYSEPELLKNKTFYLVGADNFKWKKMVVPGDQLKIVMKSVKKRNPLWIMDGEVFVDGKVVASGTLTAAAA